MCRKFYHGNTPILHRTNFDHLAYVMTARCALRHTPAIEKVNGE